MLLQAAESGTTASVALAVAVIAAFATLVTALVSRGAAKAAAGATTRAAETSASAAKSAAETSASAAKSAAETSASAAKSTAEISALAAKSAAESTAGAPGFAATSDKFAEWQMYKRKVYADLLAARRAVEEKESPQAKKALLNCLDEALLAAQSEALRGHLGAISARWNANDSTTNQPSYGELVQAMKDDVGR